MFRVWLSVWLFVAALSFIRAARGESEQADPKWHGLAAETTNLKEVADVTRKLQSDYLVRMQPPEFKAIHSRVVDALKEMATTYHGCDLVPYGLDDKDPEYVGHGYLENELKGWALIKKGKKKKKPTCTWEVGISLGFVILMEQVVEAAVPSATKIAKQQFVGDALTLAICHEVGHLFGGFPFITSNKKDISGSGGQADYFAAQVCLSKVWGDSSSWVPGLRANTDDQKILMENSLICSGFSDVPFCRRGIIASLILCRAFEQRFKFPREITLSNLMDVTSNPVSSTFVSESRDAMCRFRTFVSGLFCSDTQVNFDFSIPGTRSKCTRTRKGKCVKRGPRKQIKNKKTAEIEMLKSSCMIGEAARPRCWFKPSTYT